MKKLLFILFAALVAASANAQLIVEESGKVAVGYNGTSPLVSEFSVRGNVHATGTITGNVVNRSDYRLKDNIVSLSETIPSSLESVMQMNPVQFKYKNRQMGVDEYGKPIYMWEGDEPTYTHTHFGFIAQEIQELFPNLVYEGAVGDDYMSVSYTEMVPVLVRAIQELKAELKETRKAAGILDENTTPVEAIAMRDVKSELFQNTPNPFTENTVIPCTVAEGVATAMLYIYDLNGKQIDQYVIEGRGKSSITIADHSLEAGIYLYSLIADGNVVDTKRMILTK